MCVEILAARNVEHPAVIGKRNQQGWRDSVRRLGKRRAEIRLAKDSRTPKAQTAHDQGKSRQRERPKVARGPRGSMRRFSRQPALQTLAEACGKLEHAIVAVQFYDVTGAIEYRGAMLAFLEVSFHRRAERGIDIALDEIGDLLPHVF